MIQRKRRRTVRRERINVLDELPDDLVTCILGKLSSSASCPADFVNVLVTCKRLNRLGQQPLVLARAGAKTLAVRAKNWSNSALRFLKKCVYAGNIEACYTLGMIRFYCLEKRGSGASLMARAAIKSHALALYSLAVIQFNGSGGSKTDKNLRAGVALCARAASLGHLDALRELGHCLQDGYGVPQDVLEGRRLVLQANAREIAWSLRSLLSGNRSHHGTVGACDAAAARAAVLTDARYAEPVLEVHPVNRFLKGWFSSGRGVLSEGLRVCSHEGCGRPETRSHEFRRCSVCGSVNYCSRGCQAIDWKVRHKAECVPIRMWVEVEANANGGGEMVELENVAVR